MTANNSSLIAYSSNNPATANGLACERPMINTANYQSLTTKKKEKIEIQYVPLKKRNTAKLTTN